MSGTPTLPRWIAASAAALALVGAQAQSAGKSFDSPLGNFSVPAPAGMGARTQHQGDKDGGIVAFHDDFGSYRSVFYLRLSPRSLELRADEQSHRRNLEEFFKIYAMERLFIPAAPGASQLHGEHLMFGKESAYFALVNLPLGSTMFNARANKRFDTRRGMLVFAFGNFIYMVGSGENPSVMQLGAPVPALEQLVQAERDKALAFAAGMVFK